MTTSYSSLKCVLIGLTFTLAASGVGWGAGHGGGGHGGGGGGSGRTGGSGISSGGQMSGGSHRSFSAPSHNFSAPSHNFSAPSQNLGRPSYSAPKHQFSSPAQNFSAPTQNLSRPTTSSFSGALHNLTSSGGQSRPLNQINNIIQSGSRQPVHQNIQAPNVVTNPNNGRPGNIAGLNQSPVTRHQANYNPSATHSGNHVHENGNQGNWNNNNGNNNHWNSGPHAHVTHQHPNYWRNNSYFFGVGSPFGIYGLGGLGGYGYGGYGLNNYGYSGYGNPYYGYGSSYYGNSRFGYGVQSYGYPSYNYQSNCTCYGYGTPSYAIAATGMATGGVVGVPLDAPVVAASPVLPDEVDSTTNAADPTALDYAGQGEQAFKAGNYKLAVKHWRHALVDAPNNGAFVLLLGQALFAAGEYDEAAGATQQAAQILPPEHWGVVVKHYRDLYPNIQDYTNQLRALEKAKNEKPDAPALRFLLGWHYGYLGYPKQAVVELDKLLQVAPTDEIGKKPRDQLVGSLPKVEPPPAPPVGSKDT